MCKLFVRLMVMLLTIVAIPFVSDVGVPVAQAQGISSKNNEILDSLYKRANAALEYIIRNNGIREKLDVSTGDVNRRLQTDKDNNEERLLQDILVNIKNQYKNNELIAKLKEIEKGKIKVKDENGNYIEEEVTKDHIKSILDNYASSNEEDAKVVLETIIEWYKTALKENDGSDVEYFIYKNSAIAYHMLKKSNEAINNYSHYINEFEGFVKKSKAEKIKSIEEENKKYHWESKKNLEDEKIAVKPNDLYSKSYLGRGKLYYTLGDYNQALEDFEQATVYNPYDDEAYFYRALCYTFTDIDKKKALECVNKSIEINRDRKINEAVQNLQLAFEKYDENPSEENSKKIDKAVQDFKNNDIKREMKGKMKDKIQRENENLVKNKIRIMKDRIEKYYTSGKSDEALDKVNESVGSYLENQNQKKDDDEKVEVFKDEKLKKETKEVTKAAKAYITAKKKFEKEDTKKAKESNKNSNTGNEDLAKNAEKMADNLLKRRDEIESKMSALERSITNYEKEHPLVTEEAEEEEYSIDVLDLAVDSYHLMTVVDKMKLVYDDINTYLKYDQKDDTFITKSISSLEQAIKPYLEGEDIASPLVDEEEKKTTEGRKKYLDGLMVHIKGYLTSKDINELKAIRDSMKNEGIEEEKDLKDRVRDTKDKLRNYLKKFVDGYNKKYSEIEGSDTVKSDKIAAAEREQKRSSDTFYYTLCGYINSNLYNNGNEALEKFNKAVELEEKHSTNKLKNNYNDLCYKYRGDLYLKKETEGAYKKAIADYNKVIQLNLNDNYSKDPYLAVVYHDRGLCYKKLGYDSKAKNDFYRANELGYEKAPNIWTKLIKGVSKAKEYRKKVLDILGLFAI